MKGPDEAINTAISKLNDIADASGIRKALLIVETVQILTDLQEMLHSQAKEENQNGINR